MRYLAFGNEGAHVSPAGRVFQPTPSRWVFTTSEVVVGDPDDLDRTHLPTWHVEGL